MEPGSPPPPPPPPPPPTTTLLGKYQLGRLLGRGSFAKVHWAKSITDNTPVAIKIIDKTKTVDTAMEPRIIREVAAMRRLHHHPNILKLHEVMATKTKIYLVMELASGGELFGKVLRRGRLSEPVARKYLQQLVSALHFCHQNGVSHRDVKPQNLLLDHNGNVKVSDFGLSALPEQRKNGLLHTACGTPAYAAPEVVSRRGYDGSKADAWSCGVLLFVFLVGCLPFDDNNIIAMYKRIHKREYQIPASVSKPARAVIYQLLDPNPNTRMSIEGLMENKWFKKSLLARQETGFVMEGLKDCGTFNMVPGLGMNAFDIISLSSGLDLSGLFEVSSKKEKRFTTKVPVEGVMERLREVGGKLGYRVEGVKGGGVGLGKERVVLVVEVLEITTELLLVEVKVVEGGVEFEESCWEELREGFGDIVLSWHNDMLCEV